MIVGGDSSQNQVVILIGNNDGTFTIAQTIVTGANPVAFGVGAFTESDVPDLAIAVNQSTAGIEVFLGNGDGTFREDYTFDTPGTPVAMSSIIPTPGNSFLFLSTALLVFQAYSRRHSAGLDRPATQSAWVRFSITSPSMTSTTSRTSKTPGSSIVAASSSASAEVSIFPRDQFGRFEAPDELPLSAAFGGFAVGDFDNNGRTDLIARLERRRDRRVSPDRDPRRNIISGNSGDGIEIDGPAFGDAVVGNLIGLAADGWTAVGNGLSGIVVSGGNIAALTIGGVLTSDGNVISGNIADGIQVNGDGTYFGEYNLVEDNSIGTNASGEEQGVGNGGNGVTLANAQGAFIGQRRSARPGRPGRERHLRQ